MNDSEEKLYIYILTKNTKLKKRTKYRSKKNKENRCASKV